MLIVQQTAISVVLTVENGEKFCIRVCLNVSFLFLMQNQVPEIIIGTSQVIYHIEALPSRDSALPVV